MKVFHHDDMDGRSSAAIVAASKRLQFLREIADNYGELSLADTDRQLLREYETKSIFIECDYASRRIDPSCVSEGEVVFIVDYSFSEKTVSVLEEICRKASSVTWIDHHLTSKKLIETKDMSYLDNLKMVIDMSKSGAALCWDYLFGTTEPLFVQHVSDYDCWKYELGDNTTYMKLGIDMQYNTPDSELYKKLICDAFLEQGYDLGYNIPIENTYTIFSLIREGQVAKKYIDCENRSYFKHYSFVSDVFGMPCICVNRKTNSWVFGNAYHEYPLCCVFAYNGDVWSYSLYSSNGEVDCSEIAARYGGGGHKGAAGFSTKECILQK